MGLWWGQEMMHHFERQGVEGEENDAAKGTGLSRQIVLPPMPAICSGSTTSTSATTSTPLGNSHKTDSENQNINVHLHCGHLNLTLYLHVRPLHCSGHIKVYSYYEIDHSKLPVHAPHQLNSIRVVMVSEKSKTRVAVRFPSIDSVRLHLREISSNSTRRAAEAKRVPSLDEKYFMQPEVAEEVLYRRVSAEEIGENRNSWSFWVVASGSYGVEKKEGLCWSEIKTSDELVKWGKRKKIQYLGRYHGDDHNKNGGGGGGGGGGGLMISYEYCVKDGDQIDDPLRENEMKRCEEEEDVKASDSREVEKTYDRKRRLSVYDECSEKKKKSKKYKKVVKNSNNRWSKER